MTREERGEGRQKMTPKKAYLSVGLSVCLRDRDGIAVIASLNHKAGSSSPPPLIFDFSAVYNANVLSPSRRPRTDARTMGNRNVGHVYFSLCFELQQI